MPVRDEPYTVRGHTLQELYDEDGRFIGFCKPLKENLDWRKYLHDTFNDPKIVAFIEKCRAEREGR